MLDPIAYYEFKMMQHDGVEIRMRCYNTTVPLPDLIDNFRQWLLGVGFAESTINESLGSED